MKKIIILLFLILLVVGCGRQEAMDQITADVVGVEEAEISCEDSDDGLNEEESGFIEGISGDGGDFDFDDRCVGTILIEYYCEDDKYNSQNIRCDNKCVDGACK